MSGARALPGFTTASIGSIVRAILPAYPSLDAATRAAVEADVAAYVAGQVASMPPFLRFPYTLALAAFEVAPTLRYGRPFRSLPAAAAAAYVERWDAAPVGFVRDVVKVMRSTALLAYFDHQLVGARLAAERNDPAAPAGAKAANE